MMDRKMKSKKLKSHKENLESFFNPEPERDIDPEMEDLYINNNEQVEITKKYEKNETNNKNKSDKHNLESEFSKYKTKTLSISYDEWKQNDKNNKDDYDIQEHEHSKEISNLNRLQLVKNKKKKKLVLNHNGDNQDEKQDEDENEEDLLQQTKIIMEKEDELYLKQITKVNASESQKGKSVINQRKVFDSFVGLRIYLQNIIKIINKFPQGNKFQSLVKQMNLNKNIKEIFTKFKILLLNFLELQSEVLSKGNFMDVVNNNSEDNRSELFNLEDHIEKAKKIVDFDDFEDDFKKITISLEQILLVCEKIVNIWYRKTLVYSYKSNSKMMKILNNNFCEHIKENIDSNYDSMREKTRKKREKYKIIGKGVKSLAEEFDSEIFDDTEFYEYLLKEFFNGKEDEAENKDNENRYDLTWQFLQKKRQKTKNNVDTKSSKNRKLRYGIHEKIVNFAVPEANLKLVEGRDDIVRSIFGQNKQAAKVKTIDNVINDIVII